MHGSILGFFAYGALQVHEVAGKDVLEVGALDVNGTIKPMVMGRGPRSYLGVDLLEGPCVDRVLDAASLVVELGENSFDVVIATEMLEHTEDWRTAIANMVGVLRPGGVLVFTTRSLGFAFHHPPDHWRFSQAGVAEVFDALGFELIVLMSDPEKTGIFVKVRKPASYPRDYEDLLELLQEGEWSGITALKAPLNILGRPASPDGCGYYRFWQPYKALECFSGHKIVIPPPGSHHWCPDLEQVEAFDLIAQQRPAGKMAYQLWRQWKSLTYLVYEIDDNLFQPDPSSLPHLLDEETQRTIRQCMELSDLITVSSPQLAEVVRPHNSNVAMIPNFIHEDMLAIERPHTDPLTICWAGGANHLQDLAMIQEPINEVLDSTSLVDWHMIGVDYRPLFKNRGRFTNWLIDVWDYYHAIDGDIGVIPLQDTPFNQCRTPIKAMEYGALGIPVVASDIEPYREYITDGETGYLVKTPEEWRKRVLELVHDEAMREEMGAKAKQHAGKHTIQEGWKHWAKAYEEVAKYE